MKTPEREDPGEFMVEAAEEKTLSAKERRQVPKLAEKAAANSLHFGYGASGGVLYAALRPKGKNPLLEGAALGIGIWASGYLGWLPAVGLTPPVTEQTSDQIASSILLHAIYGATTVGVYRGLQQGGTANQ